MRILLVHVHPSAEGTTRRHWPYWLRAGYDRIVGITTEGGGCYWPNGDTVAIGPDRYIDGPHLCNRLIRTFEFGVNQGADEICVIEHDTVFFKPMPFPFPAGFTMNRTGGNIAPWKCKEFSHNPWHLDAATARACIEMGDKMIAEGDIEGGNPDLFLGLLTEYVYPLIRVNDGLFKSYTRNALDQPAHLQEARKAYRDGAHVIHGVKHAREIDYILA
jgi:hypothetical protein